MLRIVAPNLRSRACCLALAAAASAGTPACSSNKPSPAPSLPPAGAGQARWTMPNPPQADLPNPQTYDTSAASMVLDRVTGLGWARAAQPGFATWTAAVDRCSGLVLDGLDDFRLPSRIELVSLVDFRFSDPAIDPEAFPSTPAEMFWTSSRLAGSASDAWYVNFYFGSTDYGSATNEYRVRCVRGPQ